MNFSCIVVLLQLNASITPYGASVYLTSTQHIYWVIRDWLSNFRDSDDPKI